MRIGGASTSHGSNTSSTQRAFEDISPSQSPETLKLRIVALRYLDDQRNEKQADLARLTQRIEEAHAVLIGVKRDLEEKSAELGEAEQARLDTNRLKVDLRHLGKEAEQERSRMRTDIQKLAAEVEGEQQNVRVSRSRSRG
ncbi:hypothetical protein Moror_2217 [Moniliophthora roreri MCA 2997]|uniref:Uncharacterized protein n=2 Tax=Moniliophthora roreri TaxID=221103 RepID=V2WP72_MONRO|nr:hypothetical protein Moror_2217 [Moniliophthora roreri MCA 2997]